MLWKHRGRPFSGLARLEGLQNSLHLSWRISQVSECSEVSTALNLASGMLWFWFFQGETQTKTTVPFIARCYFYIIRHGFIANITSLLSLGSSICSHRSLNFTLMKCDVVFSAADVRYESSFHRIPQNMMNIFLQLQWNLTHDWYILCNNTRTSVNNESMLLLVTAPADRVMAEQLGLCTDAIETLSWRRSLPVPILLLVLLTKLVGCK